MIFRLHTAIFTYKVGKVNYMHMLNNLLLKNTTEYLEKLKDNWIYFNLVLTNAFKKYLLRIQDVVGNVPDAEDSGIN